MSADTTLRNSSFSNNSNEIMKKAPPRPVLPKGKVSYFKEIDEAKNKQEKKEYRQSTSISHTRQKPIITIIDARPMGDEPFIPSQRVTPKVFEKPVVAERDKNPSVRPLPKPLKRDSRPRSTYSEVDNSEQTTPHLNSNKRPPRPKTMIDSSEPPIAVTRKSKAVAIENNSRDTNQEIPTNAISHHIDTNRSITNNVTEQVPENRTVCPDKMAPPKPPKPTIKSGPCLGSSNNLTLLKEEACKHINNNSCIKSSDDFNGIGSTLVSETDLPPQSLDRGCDSPHKPIDDVQDLDRLDEDGPFIREKELSKTVVHKMRPTIIKPSSVNKDIKNKPIEITKLATGDSIKLSSDAHSSNLVTNSEAQSKLVSVSAKKNLHFKRAESENAGTDTDFTIKSQLQKSQSMSSAKDFNYSVQNFDDVREVKLSNVLFGLEEDKNKGPPPRPKMHPISNKPTMTVEAAQSLRPVDSLASSVDRESCEDGSKLKYDPDTSANTEIVGKNEKSSRNTDLQTSVSLDNLERTISASPVGRKPPPRPPVPSTATSSVNQVPNIPKNDVAPEQTEFPSENVALALKRSTCDNNDSVKDELENDALHESSVLDIKSSSITSRRDSKSDSIIDANETIETNSQGDHISTNIISDLEKRHSANLSRIADLNDILERSQNKLSLAPKEPSVHPVERESTMESTLRLHSKRTENPTQKPARPKPPRPASVAMTTGDKTQPIITLTELVPRRSVSVRRDEHNLELFIAGNGLHKVSTVDCSDTNSPDKILTCEAKFSYHSEVDGDLAFEEGDIITVLEQKSPDWIFGELRGKHGMFPSNFVEYIKSSDVERRMNIESNLNVNNNNTISNDSPTDTTNVSSACESVERNSDGAVDLFSDITTHQIDSKSCPRDELVQELPAHCTAAFDFQSGVDGDLTFTIGQLIIILDKRGEEWYYGQSVSTGQFGIFPVQFVVLN